MPELKLIEGDLDVPVRVPASGTVASVANGTAVLVPSSVLRDIADGKVARADLDPVLDAIDEEQEITASMAAFRKKTTGVDNTIFVSAKVPRHRPRIEVAIDPPTHLDRFGDTASVAMSRLLMGAFLQAGFRRTCRGRCATFLSSTGMC